MENNCRDRAIKALSGGVEKLEIERIVSDFKGISKGFVTHFDQLNSYETYLELRKFRSDVDYFDMVHDFMFHLTEDDPGYVLVTAGVLLDRAYDKYNS